MFAEIDIPLYENGRYIKFADIKSSFQELKASLHNPTLIGSISSTQKKVSFRFRVDSYYYSHKNSVKRLPFPIKYKEKDLYLPIELVEAIFLNLLSKEVIYEIKDESLSIISTSDPKWLKPEKIKLEYLILDAGHGGEDPGASSSDEFIEKEVNLSVTKLIAQLLSKKFPDLKVIQTRSKDEFIELRDRTSLANQKLKISTNTIFVSIHCNSAFNTEANGFEVYYLAQTSNMEDSRELSLIEYNIIPWHEKKYVRQIKSGMMSTLIQRRSIRLADSVHTKMREAMESRMVTRGVKKANFHVLRKSLMPAILVEIGFISHPIERKNLQDKQFQMKIAEGIIEGIKLYIELKDSPD